MQQGSLDWPFLFLHNLPSAWPETLFATLPHTGAGRRGREGKERRGKARNRRERKGGCQPPIQLRAPLQVSSTNPPLSDSDRGGLCLTPGGFPVRTCKVARARAVRQGQRRVRGGAALPRLPEEARRPKGEEGGRTEELRGETPPTRSCARKSVSVRLSPLLVSPLPPRAPRPPGTT